MRKHGFTGIPIEQRASLTGHEAAYSVVYRNFSRNIHSTDYMESYLKSEIYDLSDQAEYLVSRDVVAHYTAHFSAVGMAEIVNHMFSLGFEEQLDALGTRQKEIKSLESVSYTHLDVYKRQHLGRVVIGPVALDHLAFGAFAILGMLLEPTAQLGGVALKPLDTLGRLGGPVGLNRQGVVLAMAGEHLLSRLFELGGLLLEVGAGTALALAGVAGQFDAIDGEHLAADQALPVAEVDHLTEDGSNLVAETGDEVGEGGEVWRAITAECNEGDLLAAGTFDLPATDNAPAVGEQDYLE